jgi:hypothetical protein
MFKIKGVEQLNFSSNYTGLYQVQVRLCLFRLGITSNVEVSSDVIKRIAKHAGSAAGFVGRTCVRRIAAEERVQSMFEDNRWVQLVGAEPLTLDAAFTSKAMARTIFRAGRRG